MLHLQRCTRTGKISIRQTVRDDDGPYPVTEQLRVFRIDPTTIVQIVRESQSVSFVTTNYGLADWFLIDADALEDEVEAAKRAATYVHKCTHMYIGAPRLEEESCNDNHERAARFGGGEGHPDA